MKQKVIAVCLSAALAATAMPIQACAAENKNTEEKGKEEVIYIMTDANGDVENVNAVNIFAGGDVTDYGDYSSVKMLTTNDAINQDGDTITFSSDADKVYYQGTMKDAQTPWNIKIQYYMDGTEYTPEEIAGKSGKLKIHFQVTENKQCREEYYENYALQASFTLGTDICSNIQADDATIANVGSDKQLSYTILPGKGIDTTITADVTDFEMDAVTINGISLNLNVDVDDEELMDKVTQLMDATEQLNDGATALQSGAQNLSDGSSALVSGSSAINSGVAELDNGIVSLQNGMATMQNGLNALNSQSASLTNGSSEMKTALQTVQTNLQTMSVDTTQLAALTEASGAIKTGISDLATAAATLEASVNITAYKQAMLANGVDVDALMQADPNVAIAVSGMDAYLGNVHTGVAGLKTGLDTLQTQYAEFDTAIQSLAGTMSDMLTKMSALSDGINTIVANYETLDSGIGAYTDGVAQLVAGYNQLTGGVQSLANGSKSLLAATGSLTQGTSDLYDGVSELCDGTTTLADGTNEMYNETAGMDTKIQEQIDELLASLGGDDYTPTSFVSEKNKEVASVQFVIKTDAIEKPEEEVVEVEPTEETSVLQKFINLFK